ncbi:MAG: outer membrane porin, OprD family, partial [Epsilonproteobacteria bacterium]|nr:outer membrane porin, OprD family [Campylobacterota bacterium]
MKIVKISAAAALACALAVSANAEDAKPKRTLKNNMQEVYNVVPSSVDSLSAAFSEGMVYGRLRANTFYWDWQTPTSWDPAKGKGNLDNRIMGLGGSIIYKTAPLYGLSATAGVYGSVAPFWFREDIADIGGVKAGKDTISRYDVKTDGKYHMISLAQMYGQYDFSKNSVKFGRQIFESVLTKSNDTKMIPNTFEGVTLETKEIPATTIRGAYFYAQKLRDHTTF